MTAGWTLSCIRARIGSDDALEIAGRAAPGPSPCTLRQLYYPYYWFLFRSVSETILGKSSTRLACLVDGRTGLFATCDPLDVVTRSVPGKDVLDCALTEPEADSLARRCAPRVVRARRRSLVAERLSLVEQSLVHRPLWVVTAERTCLLVDGVTGGLLPLAG